VGQTRFSCMGAGEYAPSVGHRALAGTLPCPQGLRRRMHGGGKQGHGLRIGSSALAMVDVMCAAREECKHEGMNPHIEQCGFNNMCEEHKGMKASRGARRHRQQCGFKRDAGHLRVLRLGRLNAAVRRERQLSLVLVTSQRPSLDALSLSAA
jgi:hypothetical protein